LRDACGIDVTASNLNIPADGSRFEPLIGNPGDGQSPHCAIVDEYHEHADDSLYTTMITGMGARLQPLMFIITTAGYNIEGPCYDKRRDVIAMLEGTLPNDELFGVIYTVDADDDWTSVDSLIKANPNLGISVYRDNLISLQRQAITSPRFTNKFKIKHLNVWVTAKAAFFNMESWKNCEDAGLTLEQFRGHECVLGLDLARKIDMNSMARVFWRDIDGKRHYYCISPKFWIPEDTAYNNDEPGSAERWQKWLGTGHLYTTDGAEIDYREILAEAIETRNTCVVTASAIDPAGATALSHDLDDEGMHPISITQNFTQMSDPMRELEAAIASGRFHHDGNPIMTWCIGNVVGKHYAGNDDVVRPVKEKA
ncbi:MAG: terminase TerL endonuclease subunit, partial [Plesiomonas sp.]